MKKAIRKVKDFYQEENRINIEKLTD